MNSKIEQEILDDRYIIQKEIGFGYSSRVFKVKDVQTGETKVAKIFKDNMSSKFQKEAKAINLINAIDAPTNIKCFTMDIGYLIHKGKKEQKMYEILEYGDHGTLYDRFESSVNGFSEEVCKYIFSKILHAVGVLHSNGICHRDIKPENMLFVGDNYDLKLCDFGLSIKFINKENKKRKLKLQVGTKCYRAPEVEERKDYSGDKIDIFSIGIILFVLITKIFPFEEDSNILYRLIKTKQFEKYWEIIEKFVKEKQLSEQFKNLFVKMVAYNPDERPTIEEIKKDDFMKDITNLNDKQLDELNKKMIDELKS